MVFVRSTKIPESALEFLSWTTQGGKSRPAALSDCCAQEGIEQTAPPNTIAARKNFLLNVFMLPSWVRERAQVPLRLGLQTAAPHFAPPRDCRHAACRTTFPIFAIFQGVPGQFSVAIGAVP